MHIIQSQTDSTPQKSPFHNRIKWTEKKKIQGFLQIMPSNLFFNKQSNEQLAQIWIHKNNARTPPCQIIKA